MLRALEDRRVTEPCVARQKSVNPIVLNRRIRSRPAEQSYLARFVAGLLQHLSRGGLARSLAFVDHAARYLKRDFVCAVPVLFDHDDFIARRQRDDVDPIRRFDAIEIMLAVIARTHRPVAPDFEDAAIGQRLGANTSPAGSLRAEPRMIEGVHASFFVKHAQASITSTRGVISVLAMSAGQ